MTQPRMQVHVHVGPEDTPEQITDRVDAALDQAAALGANLDDITLAVVSEQIPANGHQPGEVYTVATQGGLALETWPRTLEGVITACCRAQYMSAAGDPPVVELLAGSRLIAIFKDGRRADL